MSYTYSRVGSKFRDMLRNHGQDLFLRRRCTNCSQSGSHAKYDDDCTYCHGTGYVATLEKHTMRKMIVGTQWSYTTSMGIKGMGVVLAEGCYFFCLPEVKPRHGDIIYDWNNSTDSWERYIVSKVMERRWDDRNVYLTLSCELQEGTDT